MQVAEDFLRRSRIADLGRYYVTAFVREVAANLPAGSKILDAGAGECAYKPLFAHCRYHSVDLAVGDEHWNYGHLDFVAHLDALPMDDATYDAVLCTQVLEHVPNPQECLREMARVLKAGGKLFLTVPMAQSEHQAPYDFFRYTSFGLKHLCDQAGFGDLVIRPLGGGMFTRWAYELPRAMAIFPGTGMRLGRLSWKGLLLAPLRLVALCIVRFTQLLLLVLEYFDHAKDDPFGWQLTARKIVTIQHVVKSRHPRVGLSGIQGEKLDSGQNHAGMTVQE